MSAQLHAKSLLSDSKAKYSLLSCYTASACDPAAWEQHRQLQRTKCGCSGSLVFSLSGAASDTSTTVPSSDAAGMAAGAFGAVAAAASSTSATEQEQQQVQDAQHKSKIAMFCSSATRPSAVHAVGPGQCSAPDWAVAHAQCST